MGLPRYKRDMSHYFIILNFLHYLLPPCLDLHDACVFLCHQEGGKYTAQQRVPVRPASRLTAKEPTQRITSVKDAPGPRRTLALPTQLDFARQSLSFILQSIHGLHISSRDLPGRTLDGVSLLAEKSPGSWWPAAVRDVG